ncbi:MAG: 3'(2'),5'-bisphosphate nucleotidase CysQ [Candidatus Kapabacteria bacterium]|nr:3'(2'),5'-bisphosphate nucleotidase CysQ [Candidatus Kapabacteria bacterium]
MIDHVQVAMTAAHEAGDAVMRHYGVAVDVSLKHDASPVTSADVASHDVIRRILDETGLPVVSEEDRDSWGAKGTYWLVDPLDGTKEFIRHNGEFCINIALVVDDVPSIGVIYAPALDELFVGADGVVSVTSNGRDSVLTPGARGHELRIVTSRSHPSPLVQAFIDANRISHCVPMGSALKYMRLADGTADIVPRFVGSSEWDTAAAQAILKIIGGTVLDIYTGKPLTYGGMTRRNAWHIAVRHPYQFDEFTLPSITQDQP